MGGLLLGRVRGIELRIHWSVLVIGWLVAWSLADQVLPATVEGRSTTAYWVTGVVSTLGFFAGLVAHELGHSLVALSNGVGVSSVTLWLFGGVAQLTSSPPDPRSALRIAAAGPAVSVALGVVGLVAALFVGGLTGAALVWFGSVNLLLAAFNLLPAFPLDGGRIYQAWLWRKGGDETGATRAAAQRGHTIGRVMIWIGVLQLLLASIVGGLWLILLGWFLREAALSESRRAVLDEPLHAMTVAQVMSADPVTVETSASVDDLVGRLLDTGRHASYPVVDPLGRLLGLVSIETVRSVPRDQWAATEVASVMTPRSKLVVVAPTDDLVELTERLGARGAQRALVVDATGTDERLVGIVAPSDLARLLTALELTRS